MSEERAILNIRVQPRASRNEITDWKEGVLYIRLTAPPVEGAANKACMKFLAEALGVKRAQVSLVAGEKSRDKAIEIRGLSQKEAESRLSK